MLYCETVNNYSQQFEKHICGIIKILKYVKLTICFIFNSIHKPVNLKKKQIAKVSYHCKENAPGYNTPNC